MPVLKSLMATSVATLPSPCAAFARARARARAWTKTASSSTPANASPGPVSPEGLVVPTPRTPLHRDRKLEVVQGVDAPLCARARRRARRNSARRDALPRRARPQPSLRRLHGAPRASRERPQLLLLRDLRVPALDERGPTSLGARAVAADVLVEAAPAEAVAGARRPPRSPAPRPRSSGVRGVDRTFATVYLRRFARGGGSRKGSRRAGAAEASRRAPGVPGDSDDAAGAFLGNRGIGQTGTSASARSRLNSRSTRPFGLVRARRDAAPMRVRLRLERGRAFGRSGLVLARLERHPRQQRLLDGGVLQRRLRLHATGRLPSPIPASLASIVERLGKMRGGSGELSHRLRALLVKPREVDMPSAARRFASSSRYTLALFSNSSALFRSVRRSTPPWESPPSTRAWGLVRDPALLARRQNCPPRQRALLGRVRARRRQPSPLRLLLRLDLRPRLRREPLLRLNLLVLDVERTSRLAPNPPSGREDAERVVLGVALELGANVRDAQLSSPILSENFCLSSASRRTRR